MERIDIAVFPALQGGPHNYQIGALAAQFLEISSAITWAPGASPSRCSDRHLRFINGEFNTITLDHLKELKNVLSLERPVTSTTMDLASSESLDGIKVDTSLKGFASSCGTHS